jgi:hypothetical protein
MSTLCVVLLCRFDDVDTRLRATNCVQLKAYCKPPDEQFPVGSGRFFSS